MQKRQTVSNCSIKSAAQFPIAFLQALNKKSLKAISNPHPATVVLSECWLFRNGARQFDFKRPGHDAHVLAGIFFRKMLSHPFSHVIFPKLESLSLVTRERLQNFSHVLAAVHDIFLGA
jgi:hypothetical protein